jgi:hypothetical protein
MKSIRVTGEIDKNNQLVLDESLEVIKPQKVEIDIWFSDDEDYHEASKEEIIEGIREGIRDCLTGNIYPASELWDELRIKATGAINEEGELILDEPLRVTKPQNVDVVIWFIKQKKSVEEASKDGCQDDRRTYIRELSVSE